VRTASSSTASSPRPLSPRSVLSPPPPPEPSGLQARNLFAEAGRIAARAASASTRRQYAPIFRSFGDWLAAQLGRPPVIAPSTTRGPRFARAAAGRQRRARRHDPDRAGGDRPVSLAIASIGSLAKPLRKPATRRSRRSSRPRCPAPAAAAGIEERKIANVTRHKNITVLRRYIRSATAVDDVGEVL